MNKDKYKDKVVYLHETTALDIPLERILDKALEDLSNDLPVLVIGTNKETGIVEGRLNKGSYQEVLFMLETVKQIILQQYFEDN